jgi:hypothetical protein
MELGKPRVYHTRIHDEGGDISRFSSLGGCLLVASTPSQDLFLLPKQKRLSIVKLSTPIIAGRRIDEAAVLDLSVVIP